MKVGCGVWSGERGRVVYGETGELGWGPSRPQRRAWIYSKWEEKSLEGLEWGHTVL